MEEPTGDTIRELLDRAVHSLRVATNQAARRRVRQRLQRQRLSRDTVAKRYSYYVARTFRVYLGIVFA